MKTLKIKFGLFSLLAVLTVSVFLTACEQENIVPDSLEEVSTESSAIFTMPDEINDLSDEEIIEYLEDLSEEEIASLSIEVQNDELELRGCVTIYQYCKTNYWGCTFGKKFYKLRKCGNSYIWVWGNCCSY